LIENSKICPVCNKKFTLYDYKNSHDIFREEAWNRKKYCDICKKLSDKTKYKYKILREHNMQEDNGHTKFITEAELWERHHGEDVAWKIDGKIAYINTFDNEEEQRWKNKYESLEDFCKKRHDDLQDIINKQNIEIKELTNKNNYLLKQLEESNKSKIKTKKCAKCGELKNNKEFHKNQLWCKICKLKYMEKYNKNNYILQSYPIEKQKNKTHKGYKILTYITKNPIYKEIVEKIVINKWIPIKEYKKLFLNEFPELKLSSIKKQMNCYKNYFKKKGYLIETEYKKNTYYIRFFKKIEFPIINGTKDDSIPLFDSGIKDKKTIINWNKFRLGGGKK